MYSFIINGSLSLPQADAHYLKGYYRLTSETLVI